jgi:hypothetical protein
VQLQFDVLTGSTVQAAGTYTVKWYRQFGAGPTIDNVAVGQLQVSMGTITAASSSRLGIG